MEDKVKTFLIKNNLSIAFKADKNLGKYMKEKTEISEFIASLVIIAIFILDKLSEILKSDFRTQTSLL